LSLGHELLLLPTFAAYRQPLERTLISPGTPT